MYGDSMNFTCKSYMQLVKEGTVVHGATDATQPSQDSAPITSAITSDPCAWEE